MKNLQFILFILFILAIQSCRKDFTAPQPVVNISSNVSFDTVIVPILTANCAIKGCHVTGGQVPDLTATNAWNSLTGLGYVPVDDTSASSAMSCILYSKITAKVNKMPPTGSLTATETAEILAWIKQGSQNN
jgi:hypothetical protein